MKIRLRTMLLMIGSVLWGKSAVGGNAAPGAGSSKPGQAILARTPQEEAEKTFRLAGTQVTAKAARGRLELKVLQGELALVMGTGDQFGKLPAGQRAAFTGFMGGWAGVEVFERSGKAMARFPYAAQLVVNNLEGAALHLVGADGATVSLGPGQSGKVLLTIPLDPATVPVLTTDRIREQEVVLVSDGQFMCHISRTRAGETLVFFQGVAGDGQLKLVHTNTKGMFFLQHDALLSFAVGGTFSFRNWLVPGETGCRHVDFTTAKDAVKVYAWKECMVKDPEGNTYRLSAGMTVTTGATYAYQAPPPRRGEVVRRPPEIKPVIEGERRETLLPPRPGTVRPPPASP